MRNAITTGWAASSGAALAALSLLCFFDGGHARAEMGGDASASAASEQPTRVSAGSSAATSAAARPKHHASSRWGANWFPNIELTNHEGKKVRFFDDLLKDKVVAINFIFTKCRNTCPSETAKMRRVQRLLGDRVGQDVFMYSITLDPRWDTPERLADYVDRYDIGPGWQFLTGDPKDLELIQRKLGMYFDDLDDPQDHNVSLILGNQTTGRWQKRSPHDDPYVLASMLGEALHGYHSSKRVFDRPLYNTAKVTTGISRGQYLFKTRCSSCHTIGGGDDIGPDLAGVTEQRDRDWLVRWIKEPDVMLREKDPLATALFAKYRRIPMPNQKLGDLEIEALLEFISAQTVRLTKAESQPD